MKEYKKNTSITRKLDKSSIRQCKYFADSRYSQVLQKKYISEICHAINNKQTAQFALSDDLKQLPDQILFNKIRLKVKDFMYPDLKNFKPWCNNQVEEINDTNLTEYATMYINSLKKTTEMAPEQKVPEQIEDPMPESSKTVVPPSPTIATPQTEHEVIGNSQNPQKGDEEIPTVVTTIPLSTVKSEEPKVKTEPTEDCASRVKRAIDEIPITEPTSEDKVMATLIKEFGTAADLVEPSKKPEFASALLEAIRSRQSESWIEQTEIIKPDTRFGLPGTPSDWTIRHYTNKATVTLDNPDRELRKILEVKEPPFKEILSTVTLAALKKAGINTIQSSLKANEVLHVNTSSTKSGHTTNLDWTNIGNVGDTFYALFYKGNCATGKVPAFINDALYYAEWSLNDFGEGWASSDWLTTANESKKKVANGPRGKAVSGPITEVIAHQFGKMKLQAKQLQDTDAIKKAANSIFSDAFDNFEIKKHGMIQLDPRGWQIANQAKINEIKSGYYNNLNQWTPE